MPDDPTIDARNRRDGGPGALGGAPVDALDAAPTLDAPGLATPGSQPFDELAPGERVGRYRVERLLGEGGMGVVYLARDPDLERPVALKLVRYGGNSGSDGRTRLLREAQALARLSHPNVVSIFDVGRFRDRVFLAMEFVDGASLKSWLEREQPDGDQILAALISAGRGLAAAHDKGLVHRDVKPDNIFRWRDGRVAIGDFGLARAELGAVDAAGTDDSQPIHTSLTHTGAILGTPPYMAPEQHSGRGAGARSDQFSFCVTAWEALCGQRPFPGETMAAIRAAVSAGRIARPPAARPLARRIERVLRRGLATDPAERYPSMAALLDQLAPRPRKVSVGWAAGAVLALAAATVAIALLAGGDDDPCAAGAGKLVAVWGAAEREAAAAAFTSAGIRYAEEAFPRVAAELDDYAGRFARQYRDACEDTRVRREYDAGVLAIRNACLDSRLAELDSLVSLFRSADPDVARGAVGAVGKLRPPEHCGDVAALTAAVPLPQDPALRERVVRIDRQLGHALALEQVARYGQALEAIHPLMTETDQLGYRPLEARIRLHYGASLGQEGRYDEAEPVLRDAVLRAEAGRADELVAEAWIELVAVATERARYGEAHERGRRARAAVERLGNPPRLDADLHNQVAVVYRQESRWDEAEREYRAALDAIAREPRRDQVAVRRASSLQGLAFIHYRRGELDQALTHYGRALVLRRQALGPRHPSVADTLLGLCTVREARGEFDRVLLLYQQALDIMERAFGPDHVRTADTLTVIGGTYHALGRHADALAVNRRALAIREARLGDVHPTVAQNLTNIAIALKNLGQLDEAVKTYGAALAMYETIHGHADFTVGVVENNLGEALLVMGRASEALTHYRSSLEVLEGVAGRDNPIVAHPLTGLGEARLALGDARAARPVLERALALRSKGKMNPVDLAQTRFALARALWETGARARARRLAEMAEVAYRELGEGRATDAGKVGAWLASHP